MANEHFSFLDASLRPDYPFACIVPFLAAMRKFQLSKQAGWQPNAAGLDRRRSFCLLLCFQRGTLYVYTAIIKQYMGIGFIQQTTNMHTVGAVHERPGSTRSVFRIRLGAFAGRGLCRRAIRESPLQSYREACCVKPIPIKIFTPVKLFYILFSLAMEQQILFI